MDFVQHDSQEQARFRREVRSWLDTNVPAALNLLHGTPDPAVWEQVVAFRGKLGEQGWLVPLGSGEEGGAGLSYERAVILSHELGRLGLDWLLHEGAAALHATLQNVGTEPQKREFAPPVIQGAVTIWRLLRELNAPLDATTLGIEAYRDGDDYVLNGEDIFTGRGKRPGLLWTLAVTDPDAPPERATAAFLVPAGLEGITIQTPESLVGGTAHRVIFDEVWVPARFLIGAEGDGWGVTQLFDQSDPFPQQDPLAEKQVADLIQWARDATRDGVRVAEEPVYQQELVQAYLDSLVIRLMRQRNTWLSESGRTVTYEQAQLALRQKQTALKLSRMVQDIMGPFAFLRGDDPWSPFQGEFEAQQKVSLAQQNPNAGPEVQAGALARALGLGQRKDQDRSPPRSKAYAFEPSESGFNPSWDILEGSGQSP